jgi:hypothetical protein
MGILGLVVCAPLGTAAWIMGKNDLKEMDAGAMDLGGRSNTNVGRICGMIATILLILAIVAFIGMLGLGVMGGAMGR